MHPFGDCKSGWPKEPQWENHCGSFLLCFLLVLADADPCPRHSSAVARAKHTCVSIPNASDIANMARKQRRSDDGNGNLKKDWRDLHPAMHCSESWLWEAI